MYAPNCRRRFGLAIAVVALVLASFALMLVSPAGAAVSGRPATQRVARSSRAGSAPSKKAKRAKASTSVPWGKKDIAELVLLALSPFAVMGLLMFDSGHSRARKASPGSTSMTSGGRALTEPRVAASGSQPAGLAGTSEAPSSGRYGGFDVLRIVAALMVVFSHSYPLTGHWAQEPLIRVGTRYAMSFGSLGVAIFFVTSGFLVAESWDRNGRIGTFARSRFARIWPALTLLVLGLVFVVGPVMTSLSFGQYFSNTHTFEFLWKNVTLVSGVSFSLPGVLTRQPAFGVDGSLWTLPYEIWAYVALVGLGFAGALRRPYVALVVLITALVVFRLGIPGGTITLSQRLVLGMSVASAAWLATFFFSGVVLSRVRGLFDLRKLFLPAVGVVALGFFIGEPAFYIVGLAALVIGLGLRHSAATRAIHRLGDPSYGVYIYSFPMMQMIYRAHVARTPKAMFLIAAPLALLVGYVSWWKVERPALNRFRKPKAVDPRTVDSAAPSVISTPDAAGLAGFAAADTRGPTPPTS